MTLSDRSWNVSGSASRCALRNCCSAGASGAAGSVPPCCDARSTMRAQRSGDLTTRRIEAKPRSRQEPRRHAVGRDHEVLDERLGAVRPSRSAAPRRCRRRRPAAARAVRTRARPSSSRRSRRRPATASCSRTCASSPGTRAKRGRRRSRSVEPRGDGVVGELRLVADQRAVDVGRDDAAVRRRSSCRRRSPARSSSWLSEVRSVDSSGGSIGKMIAGV